MAEHYFTEMPESAHKPLVFQAQYRGHALRFETDSGVFSRTEIDKGSEALLQQLPETLGGDVLDMGCGLRCDWFELEESEPALYLDDGGHQRARGSARQENAEANGINAEILHGDGFNAVASRAFDWIITNPPIRAGKQLIYQMFADAAQSLKPQGTFVLVVRKQQGAPSAVSHLQSLFHTVDILTKKGGFW